MGAIENFFTTLTYVSYQERIQREAKISKEEFNETIKNSIGRLNLDKQEHIIYHNFTIYMEPRAVHEYISGRTGIRLTKGVWIGGTRGHAESHQELRRVDYGTLTITNKRLIFIGKFKNQNLALNRVTFVNTYSDAIQVGKIGRERTMYFSANNGLLPYLAIKDPRKYDEVRKIYDYFGFLVNIPNSLKQIELKHANDTSVLIQKSEEIDELAKDIKTNYKKYRMQSNEFQKVNQNVEDLIKNIHAIASNLRFISSESSAIEKQIIKSREKNKSFWKILNSSVKKEITKVFKERHKISPQDLLNQEINKMSQVLDDLIENMKDLTNLLQQKLESKE
jgi:hypothetical protein